jgi:hypothetical protein
MDPIATFVLPILTVNEQNSGSTPTRGAMMGKAKARKKKRNAAHMLTTAFLPARLDPVVVVRMTRISAGTLDDDGLRSALKSVRDGIADGLKIDDGSKLIRFAYAQERGQPKQPAVRVEIFFAPHIARLLEEFT